MDSFSAQTSVFVAAVNSKIRENGSRTVAVILSGGSLYPVEGWVKLQPCNAWKPTFHPSPNKCPSFFWRKKRHLENVPENGPIIKALEQDITAVEAVEASISFKKKIYRKTYGLAPVLTDIALDTSTLINVHLCLSPQIPSYRYPHRVLILIIVLFLV